MFSVADRTISNTGLSQDYHLYVEGETWSEQAGELKVDYAEDGTSRATFVSREPLNGMEGARVRIDVDGVYFAGRLARPGSSDSYFTRPAVVLGPFAQMAATPFGAVLKPGEVQVDYRGQSIRSALVDISNRAAYPRGTVEVRGGQGRMIEGREAIFVEEVKLLEAANSLMKSADFVSTDAPGGVIGRRVFMPRPRPGATGRVKRRLTADDYPENGFTVAPEGETSYSQVVVLARNEDGSYRVRATAKVGGDTSYSSRAKRIFYTTEFVGSQDDAKQAAYDAARALERERPFEISDIPFDSELSRFDQVEISRETERRSGTWRESYLCLMDGALSADLATSRMSFSGKALLVSEQRVLPRVLVAPRSRAAIPVVPLPRDIPDEWNWSSEDIFFFELDKPFNELP